MLVALLLQAVEPAAVMAAERTRTAVATHCDYDGDSTDITVCGRRKADRYRVPFVSTTIARTDDVPAERARLLHRNSPVQDLSPFLVGGGMVGVQAGIGGSGKVAAGGLREIAP